jgi:hypothetical protein
MTTAAIHFFSPDYFTAKQRFAAVCQRMGLELHSLAIDAPSPTEEPLTIDVALAGAPKPRSALVVSSGLHGVEGFFGSAVQLAFLEQLATNWRPPVPCALILIHAINPFGFAWRRRFNEVNVDLNRNFLAADEEYVGSPPLCGTFRSALAPTPARRRFTSGLNIAKLALRHGIRSFWETLPVGQYDFDDWLFYGGRGLAQSATLLEQFLPAHLDNCQEAVHLDFHTGLGRWGDCQLLLSRLDAADNVAWWRRHFGPRAVAGARPALNSYEVRGGFGAWLQGQFPNSQYRFATAEFGTYSPVRVIQSLLDELHWHTQLGTASPEHWSRRRLAETFVPKSPRWRTKTLETGVSLINRAAKALWHTFESPQ